MRPDQRVMRAGPAGGGSGTSRARRIAGGVTTGCGVARWRAGGLWTVRGGHRLDLPWCGRRGLPYGGSTPFHGGSTRRHGHRGRIAGDAGTAGSSARGDAVLSWGGSLVKRLPQCGPGTGRRPGPSPLSFPQVTRSDCAAGWHCPLALPTKGRPARPVVVLAWAGDRSPVWGCTTTGVDRVPPRTHTILR